MQNTDINYNALVDKKEVVEFKKNKDKYMLKSEHGKTITELKAVTAKQFDNAKSDINVKDAEIRILKNQVSGVETENKNLKSGMNKLVEEIEEIEDFVEEKTNEYNDDCSGCVTIDDVTINEIVWDEYPKFENLAKRLSEYIETKIQAQVSLDWDNRGDDCDGPDDDREPEDW